MPSFVNTAIATLISENLYDRVHCKSPPPAGTHDAFIKILDGYSDRLSAAVALKFSTNPLNSSLSHRTIFDLPYPGAVEVPGRRRMSPKQYLLDVAETRSAEYKSSSFFV